MADEELQNQTFDEANAEGSLTKPVQCSALRKNGHVNIKGRPCRIVDMSTSKTGKHGHAKVHLVAIDIFTGKKMEELCPSTHNMDVPNVDNKPWVLTHLTDGFLAIMNKDGIIVDNKVRIPEGELGDQIKGFFDDAGEYFLPEFADKDIILTITSAMNEIHCTGIKST
ncbi:hypothetical protein EKO27_g10503 [Xylaria grammica]|uniref:Eukaryotic translation initiation factor 5A n=1 Tax=Xylaria grammica TaxID=363999 RepID=A0A439CR29_9PEZI|nr:putative translation initiation factor 5A [Xylaria grammica]RWA04600.1 hypothetical protein EKO27_g10503 [Xylaria grammica]GAW18640.1 hypothetical protein ANO14919_081210 [Xylariales sp. No.14919]